MSDVPRIVTVPRARPVVQLGVGSTYNPTGSGVWDETRWDESYWQGDEPLWLDVSCYVHDIETFLGRERSTEAFDVGTAVVNVKNETGWADYPPTRPVTPDDPLLEVIPGRELRIGVSIDEGPVVYFWRGVLDRTAPGYLPDVGDVVTLEAIDAKGDAGRAATAALDVEVGAGETANIRIKRILDAVNWPTTRRALEATGVTLLATELGGTAIDLMNLAADSSGGAVYGDLNGKVVYRQRDWQTIIGSVPVDGSIGNVGGGDEIIVLPADPVFGLFDPYTTAAGNTLVTENPIGSGLYEETSTLHYLIESPRRTGLYALVRDNPPAVCPSGWEVAFAREEVATRVLVARHTDETPRVFNDVNAQGIIGVETYERTDLETNTTSDLDILGNRLLKTRGLKRMPRIAAVTIDAGTGFDAPELLAKASPFKPSVFTCLHVTGGRTVIDRTMMVVGVEHTITPENWTARLALDDISPYVIESGGVWDESNWDQARWSSAV